MFDEFLERHLQDWLDFALRSDEDRAIIENGIKNYLELNPEDIGFSWPQIMNTAIEAGYIKVN